MGSNPKITPPNAAMRMSFFNLISSPFKFTYARKHATGEAAASRLPEALSESFTHFLLFHPHTTPKKGTILPMHRGNFIIF